MLGERNATFSGNFAYVLNESQVMCSLKNDLRLATIPKRYQEAWVLFPPIQTGKIFFCGLCTVTE